MNIGNAIKELRKQEGLSQVELAKNVNITQAALSKIESGNRPNQTTLVKLSAALKVPEALIYIMATEEGDIPKDKKELYNDLFPVIKSLIIKIATKNN